MMALSFEWHTGGGIEITSGFMCLTGVLLIKIYIMMYSKCGLKFHKASGIAPVVLSEEGGLVNTVRGFHSGKDTRRNDAQRSSATGETLRDVPITSKRSTQSRSSASALSKSSVSFSPKNVISGQNCVVSACCES
jgi:hypothetical protein